MKIVFLIVEVSPFSQGLNFEIKVIQVILIEILIN